MEDLIRRQDAIDAINHICPIDTEYDCALLDRVDVRCVLSDLPSAEPEQIIKIGKRSGKTLESAIDYLHSVGWLQEHDRILTESAEPERKKGKWIEYPDCLGYDGAYSDDHIVCSECYHVFSILDNCTEEFDFCPHCGAEMSGGE